MAYKRAEEEIFIFGHPGPSLGPRGAMNRNTVGVLQSEGEDLFPQDNRGGRRPLLFTPLNHSHPPWVPLAARLCLSANNAARSFAVCPAVVRGQAVSVVRETQKAVAKPGSSGASSVTSSSSASAPSLMQRSSSALPACVSSDLPS